LIPTLILPAREIEPKQKKNEEETVSETGSVRSEDKAWDRAQEEEDYPWRLVLVAGTNDAGTAGAACGWEEAI
jgi:hypothetical protein